MKHGHILLNLSSLDMWASWSTHTAVCSAWRLTRTSGSPSTPPPLSRFTLGKGAMRWDDWWWRTLENTLTHFLATQSSLYTLTKLKSWKNWLKGPRTLSICLFAGAASHFCNRRWCLPEYGQPRWAFNLHKHQFHEVFLRKEPVNSCDWGVRSWQDWKHQKGSRCQKH